MPLPSSSRSRPLLINPTTAREPDHLAPQPDHCPLQAEALKREVDALRSVLRSRGLQAQDGANADSLSLNSTLDGPDELEPLDSSTASDSPVLPGHFTTRGQPESSPPFAEHESPGSPGSPPQAFPAANQQRPPQVKVGAFARVMSFGRKKPSPRASPVVSKC